MDAHNSRKDLPDWYYTIVAMAAIIRIACEFIVSWNTCAVPAKVPRTVEGTPSWVFADRSPHWRPRAISRSAG
ncbi:hypothetical protein ACNKHM_23275 [Shigella sonnei]